MKNRFAPSISAIALLAALAIPLQSVGQNTRYKLIDLGTLGGPNNFGAISQGVGLQVLNNRGIVTGSADTATPDPNAPNCPNYPDCFVSHAFRWDNGTMTDLGALPGVNNSFGNWLSANGLISGFSQNGEIDPLTGLPEDRAVFWNRDGRMVPIGTFGGYESFANAVNTRCQVVGFATNAIPDPFNTAPNLYSLGTEMHAFLWDKGVMRDLGTLGGPDSTAFWVNEAGQIAGFSYTSSIPTPLGIPPTHPFLWENGKMRDLGTIGGTQLTDLPGLNERGQVIGEMTTADEQGTHPFFWDGKQLMDLGTFGGDHANANSLNNKGEVVGESSYAALCPEAGGGQITHAYLWRNGVKTDLGAFPGIDPLNELSTAWWINSKTQIVGIAATCDFSVFGAFLWDKGSMVDLNTLIPPNAIHLFLATYIDDRGEITGFSVLPNGDQHVFLLIPCGAGTEGCENEVTSATTARRSNSTLTEAQRLAIRRTMARTRFARIPGLRAPKD